VVTDQAALVASIVEDVLGEAIIGVYLHGSAVQGGLRPGSDIDVLAVTTRASTPEECRALVARLLRASSHGDGVDRSRPIELTVVVQDDVRPWRYPPPLDLQYGEWWRAELERGELPWVSPDPDLAIVLAAALGSARPLVGPPITDVLDPVPVSDLRRAVVDAIPALLGDLDGDEANVVLTFARMWLTMTTGTIAPKDVAATWVFRRIPGQHRAVLSRALAVYLGEAQDDWTDLASEVRPCVDHLRDQVLRVARQAR
jgi:predicted nucleotidyltransferase